MSWLAVLSAVFIIVSLAIPVALLPLNRVWHGIALLLGYVTNHLLLGTFYFLIVLPLGLTMRLFGNDPMHRRTFDSLGIPVVSVTDLMAQVIGQEVAVDVGDAVRLALLGKGEVSLIEMELPADCRRQKVIEMGLPPATILVAITRDDFVTVPGANTVVGPGDRVVAITNVENEARLRAVLCGDE